MNLGVDLGSSTSYFSRLNPVHKIPEAITVGFNNSPGVPTLVTVPKLGGDWEFGHSAREHITRSEYKHFRACKMLLNAGPGEWKKHDDYSDEFTPEIIAKFFLENQVEAVLEACQEEVVRRMVFCVPELWAKGIRVPDPKETLYRICRNIPQVREGGGNVEIVTEPEAASAYTAYCCREMAKNNPFNGFLLIVDYGGGTLDITLTEVDTAVQNGKEVIRISTRGSCGVGENHNGQIGAAGISYMTRLTEMFLCSVRPDLCDPADPTRIANHQRRSVTESPLFLDLYRDVENVVITHGRQKLEHAFLKNASNPEGLMPQDSTSVRTIIVPDSQGNSMSAPLTVGMLYRAYTDTIEAVLENELNKMKPTLEKYVADPYDPNCTNFKIVLVGGFGKFTLVERQLQRYFAVNNAAADHRLDTRLATQRETAISFGAALIANDEVTVRRTAPVSLGIFGRTAAVGRTFYNAIVYGQIMEEDVVYYVRQNPSTDKPEEGIIPIRYNAEQPPEFAIYFSDDQTKAYPREMIRDYWKDHIVLPSNTKCALGFRIDDSSVISLVISEFRDADHAGKILGEIRLDCYEKMFGYNGIVFDTDEPFDRLQPIS